MIAAYFIIVSFAILAAIAADAATMKKRTKANQPAGSAAIVKTEKENQREKARREKLETQKAQALEDLPFYDIQLQRLYITVEDTRNQYKTAAEKVNHDSAINRYGAVVKDKVVNQHIAERDKALQKLITLENQIHALENKKTQAETILEKTV